ncbi:MAG: hypothetical protein Q7T48_21110 [Cellvibrio sp.]|uniref:hypothetical protein n=1 Tax=Cellvibrio sp. TaxID=1965322 RepID=UPI00272023E2|nr:hypothetical protein [Cellvibrio sp.]
MQTQRHFWLKTVIAGGIVLGVVYFFAQSSKYPSPDNIDANVKIQSTTPATSGDNNQPKNQVVAKISSSASSTARQTITPELQERIAAMQQRRPNLQFSNSEVAAAVNRTTSWAPTEETPRELPLQPEEFTDGRQFIELDSLKIETLMPGDKINVQVDNNAKDYQVTIDRIEKHDYNSISWFGHIQGDDGQKYSVSFTRGEQLTVGGLDTPDGHYVLQGHGDKGWVASSQLLFKADTSVSDAIHPADVDPNYATNQDSHHNH